VSSVLAPVIAHVIETITISIGGVDVVIRTSDPAFRQMLEERYEGFTEGSTGEATSERGEAKQYTFDIDLIPAGAPVYADLDLRVWRDGALWNMERGDFHATWNPVTGRGRIRQSPNPYSLDSVLRIVHTLALADHGSFLMHAGSVIRNGRAYLFAGVSGVGKTTITRMAPADATLLTDEISYVRKEAGGYVAHGTPFAGELAESGKNVKAPLATIFLLKQGLEHRIEAVPREEAVREVLRSVLFFAEDAALVQRVFHAACDLVEQVPVQRLTFAKNERVWELVA